MTLNIPGKVKANFSLDYIAVACNEIAIKSYHRMPPVWCSMPKEEDCLHLPRYSYCTLKVTEAFPRGFQTTSDLLILRHSTSDRPRRILQYCWKTQSKVEITFNFPSCSYLANRCHVVVRLFSNRLQTSSKCHKSKNVHGTRAVRWVYHDARKHGIYFFIQ